MSKLLFEIEQDGDWLVATCHDPEMTTQAHTLEELPAMIRDLVNCRFDSPDWHQEVLRKREEDMRTGKEKPIAWEKAKASLRELRSGQGKIPARQGERK